MRTSTLACSRCTRPVDPADRSCARCGQPRMGAVVAPDDLRVEHGLSVTSGGPRSRPAVPPVVLVASLLLVVAAGVAVLALWLGFSGPSSSADAAPSAPPPAGAAPSPSAASDPSEPPAAPETGASLVGSASAQVPATSPDAVDGARETVGYAASNMLDDDPTTTWRMDGDGSGKVVTFAFEEPRTVTAVGLLNGYAKDDPATGADRYAQTRRITRVTWTVDGQEIVQDLQRRDREEQVVSFLPVVAQSVSLRIDAVTAPGDPRLDQTAISEVVLADG